MIRYWLARSERDSLSRQALEAALQGAPWCWPRDRDALRKCRQLLPNGPPDLRVGDAPLVAFKPEKGIASLWLLSPLDGRCGGDEAFRPFIGEAADALENAGLALSRSVPLLWKPVSPEFVRSLRARRLAWTFGAEQRPVVAFPELTLNGPSYGLTFLLAMASRAFDTPLPDDLAATAEIDALGKLHGVGELDKKIILLRDCAPRIRRLLIARTQRDDSVKALASESGIRLMKVGTAREAVEVAFSGALGRLFGGASKKQRGRIIDSLLDTVLDRSGQPVDWSPVRDAARAALRSWGKRLTSLDRCALRFVQAVADRHENNRGVLPPLEKKWLAHLAPDRRYDVVANYVQQFTDTGSPAWHHIEPHVNGILRGRRELLAKDLRILGALGRRLIADGRFRDAARFERRAARGFLRLGGATVASEISWPLSAWFRLSGLARDRKGFDAAERVTAEIEEKNLDLGSNERFVRLSRCQAAIDLGDSALPWIEDDLRFLAASEDVPDHVRWSAARWWVKVLDAKNASNAAEVILARLTEAAELEVEKGEARGTAAKCLALVLLDRALASRDRQAARAALARFRKLEPAYVKRLLAWKPPTTDPAAHVARYFPY